MKKLTPIELKKINCSKVYHAIYDQKYISKQSLAQLLDLSLPTVTQNINDLLKQNLILQEGHFSSTGGRPANIFRCNEFVSISVGVEILVDSVNLTALNIYGEAINLSAIPLTFVAEEAYYQKLGKHINNFIASLSLDTKTISGVMIAVQGLVSNEGDEIIYGQLLGATGIRLECFSKYISYPCRLIHDTEAAAFYQLWNRHQTQTTMYISLNKYIGSALIIDGKVYRGCELGSGTIEHLCLYPNGSSCYCGKKGCVDSYCSAYSLEKAAGKPLDIFFEEIKNNHSSALTVWHRYLSDLALAINNIRMVIDCDIILGGFLQTYLTTGDIDTLKEKIREYSPFHFKDFSLTLGRNGKDATVIGAAMYYTDEFLKSI